MSAGKIWFIGGLVGVELVSTSRYLLPTRFRIDKRC